ncbi:hypothetical protein TEA_004902 [Camellia sinensis var. sinensis]|uniref:THIF-type NAD/FAD binding fold domain-containing protein n=1 Tax=Camellia sinensis var. sinensis TaxID=542762 RepID=A0A4S4CW46_CAMSN|nr:hypothetical protein TEA_004902 [Camellia sinensis var. sinensis]
MVARRRTNTVGGLETPPPAAVPETEQLIVDEVVEVPSRQQTETSEEPIDKRQRMEAFSPNSDEPFIIQPRMKSLPVLASRSAIKDHVVALSVTSALSLPSDRSMFHAESDVVSIALAAQSAILVSELAEEKCKVETAMTDEVLMFENRGFKHDWLKALAAVNISFDLVEFTTKVCASILLRDSTCFVKKKLDETIECQLQYPSFEDAIAVPWKSLPRRMSKLYFAMRVIEQFEEAEGRDPGQTSKDDLPKVLKLRKELFEAQSLNESLIPDSLLERLVSCTTEFPPVCAVIGGILGQEVIKAISGKGDPLKNFFFFDAMDGKGIIEDISKPDSGS